MGRENPPIVSVIGRSGAGKTTFLTQLIAELKSRRYRLAVIKHHNRKGVEIDQHGKDTWRHFQAGADAVIITAPDRMALYQHLSRDLTPDQAVDYLPHPVDLVITEGYKQAGKPAIEVVRAARSTELTGDPARLVALVTDLRFSLAVPHFSLDDAAGVADFLERRFHLTRAGEGVQPREER